MAKRDGIVKKAYGSNGKWQLLAILQTLGVLVFFFLGNNKGYVLYKDSDWYLFTDYRLAMNYGIMPGYCLFVDLLRCLFGEEIYLYMIVFFQGALAIIVLIRFSYFVRAEFKLNSLSTIIVFMLSTLPYFYSMPEEVATHAIMTESVCFSFFYIYFIYMLKGIYYKSYKDFVYAIIISFVMTLIRKQHILLSVVGTLFIVYMLIRKIVTSKKRRAGILSVLGLLSVLLVILAYLFWYPDKSAMAFDQITYSFAGKAMYMSSPNDAESYNNQTNRAVFKLLYEYADQEEMLFNYAESADMLKWQHAIKGMNYTTRSVWKNVITFCRENGYEERQTMYIIKDIVCAQIVSHPLRFVYVTFIPIGQSLISSIFIKPDRIYHLCAVISAVLYVISLAVCYYSNKLKSKDKRATNTYIFTMMILFSNVLMLNLLFQSLQRYVVYTFGMFYVATFINLLTIYRSKSVSGEEE